MGRPLDISTDFASKLSLGQKLELYNGEKDASELFIVTGLTMVNDNYSRAELDRVEE